MAYEIVSEISYIGADDLTVLDDLQVIRKFKVESNLMDPINIIDDLEVAEGFNGYSIARLDINVVQHTATWDTEAQFDSWRAAWGEITPGADWEISRLETAS